MTSELPGELTTDIDLVSTVRFLIQKFAEQKKWAGREECAGRALTILDILDDRLQHKREHAYNAACRVETEAEERKLRRAQQRVARRTTPPVETAPQPVKFTLVPPPSIPA